MRLGGFLAVSALGFACPLFARLEPAICGTHPLKLKEEMFLHRQAVRKRPVARSAVAPAPPSVTQDIGRLAGGAPRIGVLLADLDPSRTAGLGGVRVRPEAARLVVSWDRVPLYSDFGTGARQTFQVRLYPDGRIEFAYNGISLDSGVVGI